MNKLQRKILSTDFGKFAKRFIIIAVIIVLAGTLISGLMLRPQIEEAASLARTQQTESNVQDQQGNRNESDRQSMAGSFNGNQRGVEGGKNFRSHGAHFAFRSVSEPSLGAKISLGVFAILCILIAAVYWLAVAAWLYKRSSLAGMNVALWTILGLIGNVAAVAVFLILRGRMAKCPACGKHQYGGAFCRYCGTAMELQCPNCGAKVSSRDLYCVNCGAKLPIREQ